MTRESIGTMMGSAPTGTFMGIPAGELSEVSGGSVIFGAPCATPYHPLALIAKMPQTPSEAQ